MNDKRRGRDETIDRSITEKNVWLQGSTNLDMTAEIQKQIDLVNEDKKKHGKRALRSDAVTGIEMIEKPPMEYMEKLTREEQIQFLKDSGAVVYSILKEWNPDWITAAQVIHFDEFGGKSPHAHRIIIPLTKDKDGILAFNAKAEFNLKFFTFVNKEYPKRMRERGYEVEDCKIYEEMSEEEKKENQENKPDYGLESMEFKRRKSAELDQQIGDKEQELFGKTDALAQANAELTKKAEALSKVDSDLQEKTKELDSATTDLQQKKQELGDTSKDLKAKKQELRETEKATEIQILTRKQQALPERPKTLGGVYKVNPQTYKSLVATAVRVDSVKDREAVLMKKEAKLAEERHHLELERRLPVKEQIELTQLRKLKMIVVKLLDRLPDGWIKNVLMEAVHGRDLLEKMDRIDRMDKIHHDRSENSFRNRKSTAEKDA